MARSKVPDTISAKKAVEIIGDGQRIALSPVCAQPQEFIKALVEHRDKFTNLEIFTMMPLGPCPYVDRGMESHFKVKTFSVGPNLREAVKEGRADYIPSHLSEIPKLFENNVIPLDAAIVQLSRPDRWGYCSLGVSVNYMPEVIKRARVVIGEINEKMPRTLGKSFVHLSELDWVIEASYDLPSVKRARVREEERKIGTFVSELIPDGSVVQIGIGGIAESILQELKQKKKLRIHTGTFSDSLVNLVDSGSIDSQMSGAIVSMDMIGSTELYEYCGDNPLIEMRPISYTHNIEVLSQIEGLVCITSAVEVDLCGQVNAEVAGGTLLNGVGGQLDFIRGAAASPGGKSIIALLSSAHGGEVSRIVPRLDSSSTVVTVGRADVDYVVTEYGVAHLKGKGVSERRKELISIAHPKFRDELESAAY